MKFYISIVSHHHDDMIINNINNLQIAALKNVVLVIKDNVASSTLRKYCIDNKINYISSPSNIGFGNNNNVVFDSCIKNGMNECDFFCVINPDVIIDKCNFELMMKKIQSSNKKLFTVNLYKDSDFHIDEPSLRYFPTWSSFFRLFLRKPANIEYNKNILDEYDIVDWAAGSFLVFKADLYKALNGFSDKYFMYYEDVDICYRAKTQQNQSVCFFKSVKAIHDGAYANRNILSKHFLWYIKSFITFLVSK
ncbi:glycosyltransferase family protein [Photobacterium leiognathi]|uniref:glycosyltransferase family 2 protein n=1 Tax=Photobacterium leiognathi TaxID=553611 RepID=UPI0029815106|nr:glycosyltransferase family 2 protein [Photobacterium leiognathi]